MGAVNQSLGRVIRHRSDYGAMYLVDLRYSQSEQKVQVEAEAEEQPEAPITEAEAVEEALNDEQEEEGEQPAEAPKTSINMFQNRVIESCYNEFTNRLSNWISDRLEPASLLDYGKVNLM